MLKHIILMGAVIILLAVGGLSWFLFRTPEAAGQPDRGYPNRRTNDEYCGFADNHYCPNERGDHSGRHR